MWHYPWCVGIYHTRTPWSQHPPWTSLYRDLPSPTTQICSNLFTWPISWCWHLVATEARIAGKRVVRILLECILASTKEHTGICSVHLGLQKFYNRSRTFMKKYTRRLNTSKSFYDLFKARMLNKVINLLSNINQMSVLLQCCYLAEGRKYGHYIPGYQFIILIKG